MPDRTRNWSLAGLGLLILAGAGWWVGASVQSWEPALAAFRHDRSPAPDLIRRYGCAGCHEISGVPSARGLVGPPLQDIASRVYLGGVVPNSPENMVSWIVDPRALSPRTAMPVTGITEREARIVAGYLYRQ